MEFRMDHSYLSDNGIYNGLARYFKEICRGKSLNAREENLLALQIKSGDENAIRRLIEANLRYTYLVAREYQNQGLSLADLINEGNIGLIKAAYRYDVEMNLRFFSYSIWWVRQAILQALAKQSRFIKLPCQLVNEIHRIGKIQSALEQCNKRCPSIDELSKMARIPPKKMLHLILAESRPLSLDSATDETGQTTLVDTITDTTENSPETITETNLSYENIAKSLCKLPQREQMVIRMYFGFGSGTPLTLDEIGRHLCVSRMRAFQIKEDGIAKIRRMQGIFS